MQKKIEFAERVAPEAGEAHRMVLAQLAGIEIAPPPGLKAVRCPTCRQVWTFDTEERGDRCPFCEGQAFARAWERRQPLKSER